MRCTAVIIALILLTHFGFAGESTSEKQIDPQIRSYLKARIKEFDQISDERKAELKKISLHVKGRTSANQPARLTFICTHNSRRSHMSQIWAAIAAEYYGVSNVETYSGGTEATAFNPRAVAAMKRAGLKVEKVTEGTNPRYEVQFTGSGEAIVCYSKVYGDAPNPSADFCAVMTCSQADKNCPYIKGCSLRVSLPFEDPKVADGTPGEEAVYDERCQQICREMLYLFSQVRD